MAELATETRDSTHARVPSVPIGTAVLVTRYAEVKAVVMHPQDFERLSSLAHDLEQLATVRPQLSDLALRAHELEEQPGAALEDPDRIRALLGL